MRNMPALMRLVMKPVMKTIGSMMGMNGPVEPAARRYLDAAEFGDDETGSFYASANRKKLVGPLALQTWPDYFLDQSAQDAGFVAIVKMTGVPFPGS